MIRQHHLSIKTNSIDLLTQSCFYLRNVFAVLKHNQTLGNLLQSPTSIRIPERLRLCFLPEDTLT